MALSQWTAHKALPEDGLKAGVSSYWVRGPNGHDVKDIGYLESYVIHGASRVIICTTFNRNAQGDGIVSSTEQNAVVEEIF